MFKKTAIGFAAVALTLAAGAFQPASANYAACTENPEGAGCPGSLAPINPSGPAKAAPSKHAVHAHNTLAPRPTTKG